MRAYGEDEDLEIVTCDDVIVRLLTSVGEDFDIDDVMKAVAE